MPDKKPTDNEIIKALECCKCRSDVIICTSNCPLYEWCEDEDNADNVCDLALDLINRLQAEIKVKNKLLEIAEEKFEKYDIQMEASKKLKAEIKAEAYKECIEKVKSLANNYSGYAFCQKLNNLLSEIIGE